MLLRTAQHWHTETGEHFAGWRFFVSVHHVHVHAKGRVISHYAIPPSSLCHRHRWLLLLLRCRRLHLRRLFTALLPSTFIFTVVQSLSVGVTRCMRCCGCGCGCGGVVVGLRRRRRLRCVSPVTLSSAIHECTSDTMIHTTTIYICIYICIYKHIHNEKQTNHTESVFREVLGARCVA